MKSLIIHHSAPNSPMQKSFKVLKKFTHHAQLSFTCGIFQ